MADIKINNNSLIVSDDISSATITKSGTVELLGENVATNGGLEQAAFSSVDVWGDDKILSTTDSYNGTYALVLNPSGTDYSVIYQEVTGKAAGSLNNISIFAKAYNTADQLVYFITDQPIDFGESYPGDCTVIWNKTTKTWDDINGVDLETSSDHQIVITTTTSYAEYSYNNTVTTPSNGKITLALLNVDTTDIVKVGRVQLVNEYDGINSLLNADFEDWSYDYGDPTGWTVRAGYSERPVSSTYEDPHTGLSCLRMEIDEGAAFDAEAKYTISGLTPGDTYRLKFYSKYVDGSHAQPPYLLLLNDADTATQIYNWTGSAWEAYDEPDSDNKLDIEPSSDSYVQVTSIPDFVVPANGVIVLYLLLEQGVTSIYSFDDFTLQKVTTGSSVITGNKSLISNSISLGDDEYITISGTTAGFGKIMLGANEEITDFSYSSSGVSLVDNSTNVVNVDTDANLAIFMSGSDLIIKNRLGSTKQCTYNINYY